MSARGSVQLVRSSVHSSSRPVPSRWPVISVLLLSFLISWPARAADLETLSRVLIPAYMAQNFAALCVVDNPTFVEETAGSQGHVHIYAKHVKDEVSAGLSLTDVETVLRMAADTAQSVLRKELSELPSGPRSSRSEPMARWCEKSAKPFVREIIEAHFAKHMEVERIIVQAKRN